MAEASIGAVKEFPEGKPYRVDKGPITRRERERETPWLHSTTEHTVHVPTNSTGIPYRVHVR